MTIRAVIFDIGGVLEWTPNLGIDTQWEQARGLHPGELNQRLNRVWHDGAIGAITLADVHQRIGDLMGWDESEVNAYMADVWRDYLGTLNVELADYFRNLRPRYQTAIISNSFVGAREREHALYGFGDICDFIIYSHEVGFAKPDPHIYRLACERLGLPPTEVLFLDNDQGAVEGAQAVGMKGIVFVDNAQAITEIETYLADGSV